jgi:hypothetical protein
MVSAIPQLPWPSRSAKCSIRAPPSRAPALLWVGLCGRHHLIPLLETRRADARLFHLFSRWSVTAISRQMRTAVGFHQAQTNASPLACYPSTRKRKSLERGTAIRLPGRSGRVARGRRQSRRSTERSYARKVRPCLVYAICHSALPFIRTLLKIGADPNALVHDDLPPLIAALACTRVVPSETRRTSTTFFGCYCRLARTRISAELMTTRRPTWPSQSVIRSRSRSFSMAAPILSGTRGWVSSSSSDSREGLRLKV